MAVKDKSALQGEINTELADNTAGDISPQDVRDNMTDLLDTLSNGLIKYRSVSSNDAFGADDHIIGADPSGGSITVNLPAVASAPTGKVYVLIRTTAGNTLTLDGNASETIDGATTQTIASQYDSLRVVNTGSEWITI